MKKRENIRVVVIIENLLKRKRTLVRDIVSREMWNEGERSGLPRRPRSCISA